MPISDQKHPDTDSKSQRKRDMTALQKLGERLVDLPEAQFIKVTLEPNLREAIAHARSLKSHEAKRRQLQYIGKLMRHIDPLPIQTFLENLQHKNQQSKAQFHQIERWRDKLITEGDEALQKFIQAYPHVDIQHLRQLTRKAQQDIAKQKKTGSDTELFRYLRETIETNFAP